MLQLQLDFEIKALEALMTPKVVIVEVKQEFTNVQKEVNTERAVGEAEKVIINIAIKGMINVGDLGIGGPTN